jgi:hypothetical protein
LPARTAAAVLLASAAPSAAAAAAATRTACVPTPTSYPELQAAAPAPLPASTGDGFSSSNPDVRKLFANLEGFSIPALQGGVVEALPAVEPMRQQKQAALALGVGADKTPLTDQLAATCVDVPALSSAAAARASFLLSQLEVPPAAAGAISNGPSLGVGRATAGMGLGAVTPSAVPAASLAPGLYNSYPQQQQANGFLAEAAGVRASEGGAPALPSSLMRDLSIDDDAAYCMARARLSGAGAPPGVSQPLLQQQRQQFMQPQQVPSSSVFGVSAAFPAQQHQQQHGLYGLGEGFIRQGLDPLPCAAPGMQPHQLRSSQAVQPVGSSAMAAGYGMGATGINGSTWLPPAVSAVSGLGAEPSFGLASGGLGLGPGFASGGLGANGTNSTWGLGVSAGLGQGVYGGGEFIPSTASPAGFGFGGSAAAGALQHQHVYGVPMQKIHMPVQEDVHSDDIGEILSLLNVGGS